MEMLKNARRSIMDVVDALAQAESLSQKLEERAASLERRNMELQTALCRCRDMIEDLMNAGSPNQLEHDAKIYLSILEGLIDDKVIEAYPHYENGLRAALREGSK